MKHVGLVLPFVFVLVMSQAFGQESELSSEIDKLESGTIESESVVPEDPIESAEEIEQELNEEFGIPTEKEQTVEEPVEAPEEFPEEISDIQESTQEEPVQEQVQEQIQEPVQEIPEDIQPEAPEEFVEDEPAFQEPIVEEPRPEPPPPVVQEPPQVEPPAPIVEEPIEIPEPVVEEELAPEPSIEEPSVEEPSYAEDETVPNDFEERLHKIYRQFYTEAMSASVWTQVAGEKINETYTIQAGDTLWDISVTFFGSGHYWPKVWQMNDDITNPHLISPGYMLKFIPGQIDKAPQLNIAGTEQPSTDTAVGAADGATAAPVTGNIQTVPIIPPPSRKSVPVLTNLPPSLPYIKGSSGEGFDEDGFDIQNKRPEIQDAKVYLHSYLSEKKPNHVGEIIEMNEEDSTATLYETVFIQMINGAQIGEKLSVYELGEKIYDFNGNDMGYPVVQKAEIQVQELVNSKEDVYKAIVVRSMGNAIIGNFVSREPLIIGNLNSQNVSTGVNAEIVGGNYNENRKYLGFQDVVYLNKGAQEGIREGQVFTILKNPKNRKESTMVEDLKEQIAKIKVLKTTKERATAIVLSSKDFIRAGDFIGIQNKLVGPDTLEQEFSDDQMDFEQESFSDELELE